jgi:mutator protein MutT
VVRTYPDRPFLAVGAIISREGRVLLARRGKAPSYGVWSVPGGAVEIGERVKDAVRREVREECGIEIAVTDIFEVFERIVPDAEGKVQYHYVILDYLARWVSGDAGPSDEVLESRWVAPAELPQYEMTKGTADVILRMLETGRRTGAI